MKKQLLLFPLLALALVLAGCQPPENTTRDGIALLHGYITAAEGQHPECSPVNHPENQAQTQCQVIARAIGAQNAAIDALEVYCSGPAFDAGAGPCQPPKKGTPAYQTAAVKLQAAVAGMNQTQGDIKQLLGVK
jgi:hypothetical protein